MTRYAIAALALCWLSPQSAAADDLLWSAPTWVSLAAAEEPPARAGIPLSVTTIAPGNGLSPDGCDTDACDADTCDTSGPSSTPRTCGLFDDQAFLQNFRHRTLVGDFRYSIGGELRYRYLDERNRLRPQGDLTRNTYQQWRFTPFLELGNDWVKGYVRAIDAPTFSEDLSVLPIDANRTDLMEYYIDAKLGELPGGNLRGRYGRMTLKYGDQHLISPLAWSNTFRTFEGGKLYYTGENWDVDGFVVRPSNGAASASAFYPESFDQADQSVLFSGVYATYKNTPHGTVDLFWLWNNEDEPSFAAPFGYNRQDGSRHTLGARHAGSYPVNDGNTLLHTWN